MMVGMKTYYQDDYATIYHADCREVLPTLDKVDLVLTDPPYGIAWSKPLLVGRNSRKHDGIQGDKDTSARDEALRIAQWKSAIVFGSFLTAFPVGVKQVLIWGKPADSGIFGTVAGYRRDIEPIFLMGEFGKSTPKRSSILTAPAMFRGHAAVESGSHPHVKPVALCVALIQGTDAQTILDPFMGSGTTLRAAKDLRRKCIGIELEERYCEIAAKRLQQEVLTL